ncbi:MAG: hypothetical protein H7Z37_04185 [Pyrinomonadaceae bacterium]|nr:hypothetical protein [Pyrinomonadaceae bacterium]
MTADEIIFYLRELNDELAALDVKGEICIYGGAAMCLVFKARPSTKDVSAIFEPVKYMRGATAKIAEKHNLPIDWLNFGVKMFVVQHDKKIFYDLPNLKVYVPTSDYLLAMKVLAARADTFDLDDTIMLIKELDLRNVADVLEISKSYYPGKEIKAETTFQLEELFENI